MGNGFGERLRAERLARGLTQADLGRNLYSSSYISLLETGRREPTADVIEELARRLELTPNTMEAWGSPVAPGDAEFVLAELLARQAWDLRDYSSAGQHAEDAARIALDQKNTTAWWNMSFLQARCSLFEGDFVGCQTVADELMDHPLTAESPGLAVQALTLRAMAYQGQGLLKEAVTFADQAVAQARELPQGSSVHIKALRTAIAALAESGALDDAWRYCSDLAELVQDHAHGQVAGEAHWVIGNVAFLRMSLKEGVSHHEQASQLLSPASDIELWAQFNKASAWVRLSAGITDPETLRCIERTELAFSIVGGNKSDRLEVEQIRARWDYLTGDSVAAVTRLRNIYDDREGLARHTVGEVALLLGQALKATGEAAEARSYLQQARDAFTEAGATDRAALAWDLVLEIQASERIAASQSATGKPAAN
ncbi:helix-turn-helix domain-containing protein [Paenarthrobacter sp. DKR-5]|uniref:helix-turn-helix domain-containing protein n=1 Tax=Paenarthrobacter sp. DKR-5 TaxID=2835535 RepID=UPI001BDC000C|nr:helix-turn-helix transcriptional regulator [Paenarthrobacter sp. DKR-5]MBT1001361.1 helix-turn-helix domain-containing protein [Paenarthrobacter sp. DKR-5]